MDPRRPRRRPLLIGLASIALATASAPVAIAEPPAPSVVAQSWEELTPEQQNRALSNYQEYQSLEPEQRKGIESSYARWKSLSPEQRQKLRQRHEQLLKRKKAD